MKNLKGLKEDEMKRMTVKESKAFLEDKKHKSIYRELLQNPCMDFEVQVVAIKAGNSRTFLIKPSNSESTFVEVFYGHKKVGEAESESSSIKGWNGQIFETQIEAPEEK